MAILPENVVAYKQTPVFDEKTIPAALLHSHNTKAGVWGKIHILEGELMYRTLEPATEQIVDKDTSCIIIRPQELHEVELRGPVLFYVEFYAAEAPAK